MTFPAILVVVFIAAVLVYLVCAWDAETRDARRLGRVSYRKPSRINQVRRDPSPTPRRRIDA